MSVDEEEMQQTKLQEGYTDFRLFLQGKNQIVLENYGKLLVYESECIAFGQGAGSLVILGKDLWITSYCAYECSILGKIESISFPTKSSLKRGTI